MFDDLELKAMLRTYAQLVRLPNVFTAWADICMGWMVARGLYQLPYLGDPAYPEFLWWLPDLPPLLFMLAASGCLYLSGMVWNDYFDAEVDNRERPWRPIPSGRVSKRTAAWLGTALMILGVCLAGASQLAPGLQLKTRSDFYARLSISIALILAIFAYNRGAKNTPGGPLVMGFCRFFNVWLGIFAGLGFNSQFLQSYHVAGVVGLYITGVTWFARKEAGTSPRGELCLAAAVIAAAIALAVFLPLHRWSREAIDRLNEQGIYVNFEPDGLPLESFEVRLYPYYLLLLALHIAVPIGLAIRVPSPQRVQFAVKCCILGLIGLDAVMAFCVVGWPGLLILLLLAPALVLGKWVYST